MWIKNRDSHFFNDVTNLNNLDTSLLYIDKVTYKKNNRVVYDIKYSKNLNSSSPHYLVFNNVNAYIEENNGNKYLNFVSTERNKKALNNYKELWDEIKDQIQTISGGKPIKYGKSFMKIKFESDNNLSLNTILNIPFCVITTRSVFQENNNYYPQVFCMKFCMKINKSHYSHLPVV